MSEFKVQQNKNGAELSLALSGMIDEDVQLPAFDLSSVKEIIFDLKDVKAINSVGIRAWLNWIKPLSASTSLVMKNCPKALVFQFNMVEGFLPKGSKVESLFVPFFCEKCDIEQNVLFHVGQEIKVNEGAVILSYDVGKFKTCKQADCSLEMDVSEAKYFHFLKRVSA